jgi:hypothetical protein
MHIKYAKGEMNMVKKLGALLFLVCSIMSLVVAFVYRANASQVLLGVLQVLAVIGAILTGSKGVWIYVVGWLLSIVGVMKWIPNETVSMVFNYGGQIVEIVAMFFIWKDSIKDIFAK